MIIRPYSLPEMNDLRKDDTMASRALNLVAALLIVSPAMVLTGCQQPNEKQARLLAAQNADLQQQLTARRTEIQAIRQKHAEELRQQGKELAACRATVAILQKDVEKGIAERVSGITTTLVEENAGLRREVEQLKTQIEELKKQAEP